MTYEGLLAAFKQLPESRLPSWLFEDEAAVIGLAMLDQAGINSKVFDKILTIVADELTRKGY